MLEVLSLEVSIPFSYLSFFIISVSIAFLLDRPTLGLMLAFVFVFYWASWVNRELLLELLGKDTSYPFLFYGAIAFLVALAGLGVISARRLSA